MVRSPRPPKGLVVNFPHNPTTATADLRFYERVVELARREKLWVISDLAYGANGSPPTIPPQATLVFDVELLDIVK